MLEKSLIPIIMFLLAISGALAAVSIQIEYNVTSTCSGTIALTLNPQTVLHGGSVTPSASGLSACDAKVVVFRSSSCSGTQVSSCSVSGTGCTGSAFTAPGTGGSYIYYACIDKNDDSDFADAGESNSQTLNVIMSSPSVSSLIPSPGTVDLIPQVMVPLKVRATITNADGASYISSCYGYLWSPSVSPPYTDVKATYTNSSCYLSGCAGTTCSCDCGFNLQYYDLNGTWITNMTAKTSSNTNGTNQGTFAVNPLAGIGVGNVYGLVNATNPFAIVFATLYVGDVSRSASTNPLKIINFGNTKLKCFIYGENSVGETDSSWVIGVGNMTYNSTPSGMTTPTPLTLNSVQFTPTGGIPIYPNLLAGMDKATFNIYNYLSIPLGFKAQTYRTTYYLDVQSV